MARFPWGSVLFGTALVALTGGVIYYASKSSRALDQSRELYERLSRKERFVGMLYLDAALNDVQPPREKGPPNGSQLAILAMNLLSGTSPADRAQFAIEYLGGPAGVSPREQDFTGAEVRLIRAALDQAGIPYSSPEAERVIAALNVGLASRLGISIRLA